MFRKKCLCYGITHFKSGKYCLLADTAMADLEVDSMTDAELRTKLAEHGFPVMPITASTRKLLVKKMKLVLSDKGKRKNSMDHKGDGRPSFARPSGKDCLFSNGQYLGLAHQQRTYLATKSL